MTATIAATMKSNTRKMIILNERNDIPLSRGASDGFIRSSLE